MSRGWYWMIPTVQERPEEPSRCHSAHKEGPGAWLRAHLLYFKQFRLAWGGGQLAESEEHMEEHTDHSRRDSKDPGKIPKRPENSRRW